MKAIANVRSPNVFFKVEQIVLVGRDNAGRRIEHVRNIQPMTLCPRDEMTLTWNFKLEEMR